MNVAVRPAWILPDFLAWEERQKARFEFDGIAPVAMTGGTMRHEAIGGTLRALLRERLLGTPCRVFGPTLKIEVQGRIRYPDAFVMCSRGSPDQTVVADSVVVFEVLSPGTSLTDRIIKPREYQTTPSILRYVVLEQDAIPAAMYVRHGPDWIAAVLTEGDVLDMPEIGTSLPMVALYADSLDAPAEDAAR